MVCDPLQVQRADTQLVEADVVGQLVTDGPYDLFAQQIRVVSEVSAQRVAKDHDAIVVLVSGGAVAFIQAVGAARATAV